MIRSEETLISAKTLKHRNELPEDWDFLKNMGRDAIYIPATYKKIVICLCFRSRVFLDIPTQQNEINKHQNIETKKRILRIQTLISIIY